MEKKWTPGPWEVVEHSWSDTSISSDKGRICSLSIYDDATEENQEQFEVVMRANALLIAAAPELYEALEAIIEGADKGTAALVNKLTTRAKSALAKARGETGEREE